MAFQSPSERLGSLLMNLIFLRRVDGLKLGRALWFLSLVVYGSMICVQVFGVIALVRSLPTGTIRFGLIYNSTFTILTMLIYILLVRLAIEVAFNWLEKNRT